MMRTLLLLLACLACAGYARRVQKNAAKDMKADAAARSGGAVGGPADAPVLRDAGSAPAQLRSDVGKADAFYESAAQSLAEVGRSGAKGPSKTAKALAMLLMAPSPAAAFRPAALPPSAGPALARGPAHASRAGFPPPFALSRGARAAARSAPLNSARDELIDLAEGSTEGLSPGFWDPLGCSGMSFWTLDNDQTVGYLRHAEIKHGRIAMAGFLGYCVQCLDIVKGEHSVLPYRGFVADVTPQEQWDNIPVIGKLQILTFVGMLESYGEIPGEVPHYTAPGGVPGYYPPIAGNRAEISLNLYDPFDFFVDDDAAKKERGLNVELNNGRAAMLAIMAMLSESKGLVVPPLDAIPDFPKYSGDVMIPFEGQFHAVPPELTAWTENLLNGGFHPLQ